MEHEYGATCRFQPLPFTRARWITAENTTDLNAFMQYRNRNIFIDKDERPVYLAESEYVLNSNITSHPKVQFHATSEFKLAR
jgi:peptide chain release factor 3